MKDLMLKEQLAKKLVDQYVSLYFINKVVSTNTVKLQTANFDENLPGYEMSVK